MEQSLHQNGTVDLPNGVGTVNQHGPVTVDKDGNVTIPTANGESQWIQLERLQYQMEQ